MPGVHPKRRALKLRPEREVARLGKLREKCLEQRDQCVCVKVRGRSMPSIMGAPERRMQN